MTSVNRTPSSGGVRNLRAMFENKGADNQTSPPSRGRSPAPSDTSVQSRPVSKVRTSFVAVERPGDLGGQQWGLRKMSDVSSMAEVKEEAFKEQEAAGGLDGATDKESAVISNGTPKKGATEGNKGPDSVSEAASSGGNISKGQPSKPPSPENSKRVPDLKEKQPENSTAKDKVTPQTKSTQSSTSNPASTADKSATTAPSTKRSIPPKISTAKDSKAESSRKPPKSSPSKPTVGSPTTSRAPKTPSTPGSTKSTVKKTAKDSSGAAASAPSSKTDTSAHKTSRPSLASTTASSRARTSAANAAKLPSPKSKEIKSKDQSKGGEVTTGGFIKPKPKSPTRPVRLPAAATASTTSSSAKTGGGLSRSPSRVSVASKPTEGPGLARKNTTSKRERLPPPSTTNNSVRKSASRASLSLAGANSTTNGTNKERPKSRVSISTSGKAPDDSFLARMMRPTASSSQKTHESEIGRPKSRVSSGKTPDDGFLARMMRPTTSSAKKTHDEIDVKASPPRKRVSDATSNVATTSSEDGKRPSSAKKESEPVMESNDQDFVPQAEKDTPQTESVQEAIPKQETPGNTALENSHTEEHVDSDPAENIAVPTSQPALGEEELATTEESGVQLSDSPSVVPEDEVAEDVQEPEKEVEPLPELTNDTDKIVEAEDEDQPKPTNGIEATNGTRSAEDQEPAEVHEPTEDAEPQPETASKSEENPNEEPTPEAVGSDTSVVKSEKTPIQVPEKPAAEDAPITETEQIEDDIRTPAAVKTETQGEDVDAQDEKQKQDAVIDTTTAEPLAT